MRNRNRYPLLAIVTCLLASAPMVTADHQVKEYENRLHDLSFTKAVPGQLNYQGYLANAADSSAVTGTLGMTFRIFDSETDGTELWSENHTTVEVTGGVFHVLLGSVTAFPAGLFDGATLYLQIEAGTDVLTPRKPLVSVPYSQRSNSAEMLLDNTLTDLDDRWVNEENLDHLDAADGDPAEAVYVDSAGQVGIGTSSPAYTLEVNGDVSAAYYYGDGSNLTGIAGAPDNDWIISGNHMYSAVTGSVGIGAASPTQKLDVAGTVQMTGFQMPTGAVLSYVLTSDSCGAGSWQPAVGGADGDWTIVGDDMYSNVSGNVGIGTTFPTDKLSVAGEACFDGALYAWDGTGIGLLDWWGTLGVWVEDGGQVGIGTLSPDHDLDVEGSAGFSDSLFHNGDTDTYLLFTDDQIDVYAGGVQMVTVSQAKGTAVVINEGSASVDFRVETDGDANTLFVRGSDDRVGIGTDFPAAKFHVLGDNGNQCWLGGDYGAHGKNGASDNVGQLGTPLYGVYGQHDSTGNHGRLGDSDHGVYGHHLTSSNYGFLGDSDYGAYGKHVATNNHGYLGSSEYGAYGMNFTSRHFGYLGGAYYGVYGSAPTAGYFSGNVEIAGNCNITGTLTKGGGSFLIDHPLDPTNKMLRHNFVESPENLLIYRGKARLDANGQAVVEMPDYFVALTREDDASIHLTPVGRPFLTGAEWGSGFRSMTIFGEENREVFWEVLADRDDPVIRQLARPVVEDKGSDSELCDRGELLYPTAYGYPESMGRDYKVKLREEMNQPEPDRGQTHSEAR